MPLITHVTGTIVETWDVDPVAFANLAIVTVGVSIVWRLAKKHFGGSSRS